MKRTLSIILVAALAACATDSGFGPLPPSLPPGAALARDSLRAEDILRHTRVLASDEFEGRLPGTRGEERTVAYLTEQFKALGLAPGNPDGSYVQKVPLVGIDGTPTLQLRAGKRRLKLDWHTDYVAATTHVEPVVSIKDSPLVFVGYGVQAPEYGWDDYKGVDVRGKTLVMLINDPAVPDPADPSRLDERLFKGRAMTYYGRWTYKYEIAGKLGAAGAIIVHETEPASYPWSVVSSSWSGEQFTLARPDQNAGNVPVQSWITLDKARELFAAAGADFDALHRQALQRDFKPVALDARASVTIRNKIREVDSHNVVARVPGREAPDETVVISAHWDHLGHKAGSGDTIYNGALDNASGVAGLLELAEAFAQLDPAPRRSVLFLAVTAEEQGLLGSQYYAEHPLYPLARTAAMLNMDGLSTWGPTVDIDVVGSGQNTLEDLLVAAAGRQQREVRPDSEPQKGSYYRSDQFNFAKQGVPALYADSGVDVIGKPGYGKQKNDAYTAHDYHQPSDEVKPEWDLSGAAQDLQLLFDVALQVASGRDWPQWKEGSEFRAVREQTAAQRGS